MHSTSPYRFFLSGLLLLMVILPFVVTTQSKADTIFNSFLPGDTYSLDSGFTIGAGSAVGGGVVRVDQGDAFKPIGTSYSVDNIVVPIGMSCCGPSILDLWLMSDVGGMPGAIIESFHLVDALLPVDFMHHAPIVASSMLHPVLLEGTSYWLIASAPTNVSATWFTGGLLHPDPMLPG